MPGPDGVLDENSLFSPNILIVSLIHAPVWPGIVWHFMQKFCWSQNFSRHLSLSLYIYIHVYISKFLHTRLSSARSLFNVRTSFHQEATNNGATFTKESLCSPRRRHRPPTRHRDSRYMHKAQSICNKMHVRRCLMIIIPLLINDVLACVSVRWWPPLGQQIPAGTWAAAFMGGAGPKAAARMSA